MHDFVAADREWIADALLGGLTTKVETLTPSQWAEQRRYLPPSVTPMPGLFRFDVAPYLREILDCLSVDSPIREVSIQKGVQLCLTTGVLENALGYYIDHVKNAPMMMVTADFDLAKLRLDQHIIPMLQQSDLEKLIRSSDVGNARKTGRTERRIEWAGGGYLIPFGAQNANKLRSVPIRIMLRDEIDGWPETVGKDGDPIQLSADRTAAFESNRKILDISTPNIKGQSRIAKRFALGDQRRYFVCCLKCGHSQTLRWRRTSEDGEVTGLVWEVDEFDHLIPGSTRYLCERCGHAHKNEDKLRLLDPAHGAQWIPTATPSSPYHRSYHLSALYSPVGMQTWDECARKWLEAWDDRRGIPKDVGKLQVFYNNVLGEPFELRGEKLRFDLVSEHRRSEYAYGEIPNRWAEEVTGSVVMLLVCTVDVHKDNLAVAVWGWARDRRVFLINYWRFAGDTEQIDEPATWGRLQELIEERDYIADDGKRYRIALALIDSGYRTDQVYRFAAQYSNGGVYPVKGREALPKRATDREFMPFTTPMGTTAYGITVDVYKERWSAALRHQWDRVSAQPVGYFNAPHDAHDSQLRELTAEVKREKIDPRTKQRIGWEWHRTAGVANELWDLLVYANAALDLIAWDVCVKQLELPAVIWPEFYAIVLQQTPYFTLPQ